MREVLISIQPKWCELIASGKKTVEVRKTKPKCDVPFKCYIYCTLSGSNEFFKEDCGGDIAEWNRSKMALKKGKVIAEFVCDRITPIAMPYYECVDVVDCETTCLSPKEILDYANHKPLYGWHISELKIYDKPKELSEFRHCHKCEYHSNCKDGEYSCDGTYRLTRPPQSWCYVGGSNI